MKILSSVIYAFGLYFNLYKLFLVNKTGYGVYPWSKYPQPVKTPNLALLLHLIVSLALFTLAWLRVIKVISRNNKIFMAFHFIFAAIVIPYLKNFGNHHWTTAVLINGGMLILLVVAYYYLSPETYFLLLSIPILFEVGLYYYNEAKIWVEVIKYLTHNIDYVH